MKADRNFKSGSSNTALHLRHEMAAFQSGDEQADRSVGSRIRGRRLATVLKHSCVFANSISIPFSLLLRVRVALSSEQDSCCAGKFDSKYSAVSATISPAISGSFATFQVLLSVKRAFLSRRSGPPIAGSGAEEVSATR